MKITCLVDNAVKAQSPFWGEHGLSFLIETEDRCLLFDTGASGPVLLHNLNQIQLRQCAIDTVALSHSHPDHTGGLPQLLLQRQAISLFGHPDLLRPRFAQRNGDTVPKSFPMAAEDLQRQALLRLDASPQEIFPGIWTTGEITERNEPEGRSPHHVVKTEDGWAPDPYRDDMALVLNTVEGLFVLCGCCHAGLLNTLDHIVRQFGEMPVAVAGGTHLAGSTEEQLEHIVRRLRAMGAPKLYLNHCTGSDAFLALASAFPSRVTDCPAGTTIQCRRATS
jgi:7,8-dihydropterin-6-yl-methyl-4-(beta-D-ribofuranosyl)aminobenzene 5'-phosphate synthase